MHPLIRLEGVDVAIDGTTILHDLRWSLRRDEHWAVLGGNGSGKSTFLKLIRGELAPAPGGMERRVYGFDGEEQFTAVGIREKIALVSPELQTRYLTQEWSVDAKAVIHSGVGGGDYPYRRLNPVERARCEEVAALLGIVVLLRRNVQELSTGELRKVLIARALAGSPRVLVCDEVCDGLDAKARESLLGALDRVARAGTQLLMTTHRNEEIVPAITHRLVLRSGRIIEGGEARDAAVRIGPTERARPHQGIPSQESEKGQPRRLQTDADRNPAGLQTSQTAQGSARAKVLVRIERANVFLSERRVLHDINLEIRCGEHWAVLGPNGAGKSTLLKLIVGDLHPALGGSVRRFEFTPENTIWEVKRRISVISPELQSNYRDEVSGLEAIASGFYSSIGLMQKPGRSQLRRASELARALGLGTLLGKSVLRMSYGEFRRILLARALVQRPELLICDEPFDGLDVDGRRRMAATLQVVANSGTNLVLVTHHADDLPGCLTHVLELRSGKIMFQGGVAEHAALRREALD